MGRISIVSEALLTLTLSLRAQCEQALMHDGNGHMGDPPSEDN